MRRFLFAIALALLASCTGKAPKNGALIQGRVSGCDPADTVIAILFHFEGDSGQGIQEDTLKDGHFTFRLDSLSGENYYGITLVRFEGNSRMDVLNNGPEIYLEPGAFVRIQGESKYFMNPRISSPVRDQLMRERFMTKLSPQDLKALQDVQAHRNQTVNDRYYRAGLTSEQIDSLRKVAQEDLDEMNRINDRLTQQKIKLLETEEIGTFALHQIKSLAQGVSRLGKEENREAVLRLYERLSEEQKTTSDGIQILNYLNPVKTVDTGSPIPDYEYIDKYGKAVKLSDFEGKWILVDFWSRSCGPCIKSVPELGAVSKEYQDRLSVISINLDKEKGWKEASEEHGIFWNDWNDPNGSSGSIRAYGTTGIPTFVLVNPEGIIHDIFVGYGEGILRSAVQQALMLHSS